MAEVVSLLEYAGNLSLFAIAVLVLGALFVPMINEWVKSKFAGDIEVQKVELGLASDYYKRRLETYLSIWKMTQDLIRDVMSAANPRKEMTWDEAENTLDALKNAYWDNRPLFSIRVHGCVRKASSFFDRVFRMAKDGEISQTEGPNRWNDVIREVRSIQGHLLKALAEDLDDAGLSFTRVLDLSKTPSDEQVAELPMAGPMDSAMTNLVTFVGRGQTKLPYVGVGNVIRNFNSAPGIDTNGLIDFALADNLLERYQVHDGQKGTEVPALRVVLSNEEAREMLDQQVIEALEAGTSDSQPVSPEEPSESPDA